MHNYYIHINDKQKGPFSVEQLKGFDITSETMVWHEGMDNWTQAGNLDELRGVVKILPPPIIVNKPKVESQKVNTNKATSNSRGILGNKYAVYAVLIILLIVGYNFIDEKMRQNEAIKQMEIQIQEQQRIEAERAAEEQRRIRAANLKKLQTAYDQAITDLRAAKIKLEDIQSFHFLRTDYEKEEQVQNQLEIIRELEKKVNSLKNQISYY